MTNPKGTRHETASVNWLREHGWPYARRVAKEGARDRGDVTLGDGIPVTIENKNEIKLDFAGGQRELKAEMANNGHDWGFSIHKKKGTTDVGEHYAVLPVRVMMDILAAALDRPARPALEGRPAPRRRSIPRYDDP